MAVELSVRSPGPADADAIADVCNEVSQKLYGFVDVAPQEVRQWLSLPDAGQDLAEQNGEVVGYADFHREEDRLHGQIDLRARPGTSAPAACEARHSFHMRIDFGEPPEPVDWPAEFTLRTYIPADERAVYECHQEAFRDQWDFRPISLELWRHFMLDRPRFEPTLWWLAEADGDLAGVCLNDWHASGDPDFGWIALLRHSFVDFAERRATRVGLGVDAENTTGAVRLYERAGMRPVRRLDIFEQSL